MAAAKPPTDPGPVDEAPVAGTLDTEVYTPITLAASVPGQVARERAARLMKKRNEMVLAQEKNTMVIPGGAVVGVGKYLNHRYNFKQNWWLGNPEKLLIDPKDSRTGYTYGWVRKVDAKSKNIPETMARVRSGRYRPIDPKELHPYNEAAIIATHDGINGGDCVLWGDLMLVEMPPHTTRAQYDAPVMEAMTRLSSYEESFADDVEQLSEGKALLTQYGPEGDARLPGV